MSKIISWCALIVAAGVAVALSACAPAVLGDTNTFLKNFTNHELLSVLGVILAITIASAGQLHLTLNEIEEKHKAKNAFVSTRNGIKSSAHCLIWLFLTAVIVVLVKPIVATQDWSQSLFNGAALEIVLWNVLILFSITNLVFAIKPE